MKEKINTMGNKINRSSYRNNGESIDLMRIWGALLDNRALIIKVIAAFMLLGILYAFFATPVYKADALLQVENRNSLNLLGNISSDLLPGNRSQSDTEVALLTSRMIMGKTVAETGLDIVVKPKAFPVLGAVWRHLSGAASDRISVGLFQTPASLQNMPMTLTILDDHSYRLDAPNSLLNGKKGELVSRGSISLRIDEIDAAAGAQFEIVKLDTITAVKRVLKQFAVIDKIKDSGVLIVTLTGENPDQIVRVLNSISENFVEQDVLRKSQQAELSLEFIDQQLPIIRRNLEADENRLNGYRQENNSVDLSLEAKSVLDSMVNIESQLNEIAFKEAELSKLYTKKHPSYQALIEKRNTLTDEKLRLEKRVSDMPQTHQEILRLTRDVQSGQEMYVFMLSKQQELSVSKASIVSTIRIIDPALIHWDDVQPKKAQTVVISILVGAIMAVLIIVMKMVFRKGIDGSEQLTALDIEVYACVPHSDKLDKTKGWMLKSGLKNKAQPDMLLALEQPTDLAVEAIRNLRTGVQFTMPENDNRTLMISGPTEGVGKSFVSSNLSSVMADAGKKVLLIDCDMRRGRLHKIFKTGSALGLSELLHDATMPIPSVVQNSVVENVSLITRGAIPPNPSELLMGDRLAEILDWAKQNYDLVILDTPPVLAVTDAAVIAVHAGMHILVARFEKTTIKEIENAYQRLEQAGVEVKGVVLNDIARRAANYYAYGGYEYYSYSANEA